MFRIILWLYNTALSLINVLISRQPVAVVTVVNLCFNLQQGDKFNSFTSALWRTVVSSVFVCCYLMLHDDDCLQLPLVCVVVINESVHPNMEIQSFTLDFWNAYYFVSSMELKNIVKAAFFYAFFICCVWRSALHANEVIGILCR